MVLQSLFERVAERGLFGRSQHVRDNAVDALDDPLVVVDEGEVLDANEAFVRLFEAEAAVGRPLADVLSENPTLQEHVESGTEGVVEADTVEGDRCFDVIVSTVTDDGGARIGRLALLHDVTEHHHERRELERQNEQLDQFASLISHDLRNPLDVAMGRTTALQERIDDPDISPHLDEIENAHRRMRQIIGDVLTLARQGQDIDETEAVDIADLAEDAWSHVETDGATLSVETDLVVAADRDRLAQVFENLFRNSVEHGAPGNREGVSDGGEVTVTVGTCDGGLFVADDGPGIPAEERERVLEAGYTADNEGTGLGLAIVASIVEAHGWDLSVTESESGGARFEITGVDETE